MKVKFFATLRRVVGEKEVQFDVPAGVTVRQLLDEMTGRFPDLRREMLDEHGQLLRHVHIFVNSRDANFLANGLDTPLKADDEIGVFPAVGGGSISSF